MDATSIVLLSSRSNAGLKKEEIMILEGLKEYCKQKQVVIHTDYLKVKEMQTIVPILFRKQPRVSSPTLNLDYYVYNTRTKCCIEGEGFRNHEEAEIVALRLNRESGTYDYVARPK